MSLAVLRAVSVHAIQSTSSAASDTKEIGCTRPRYIEKGKEGRRNVLILDCGTLSIVKSSSRWLARL